MTSGLKKVTDDMKTKNRPDRTSVVPADATAAPASSAATGRASVVAVPPAGKQRLELEADRKWVVENYSNNKVGGSSTHWMKG